MFNKKKLIKLKILMQNSNKFKRKNIFFFFEVIIFFLDFLN